MKYTYELTKKTAYIGAGVGFVSFALYGLWQGVAMGGTLGIAITNSLFFLGAGATLMGRVTIAASMIAGILVAAVMFIVLPVAVFWAAGNLICQHAQSHAWPGKHVC